MAIGDHKSYLKMPMGQMAQKAAVPKSRTQGKEGMIGKKGVILGKSMSKITTPYEGKI